MPNVTLVWTTPETDALIAKMARVSNPENEDNTATAPRLIRYLIREKHWSPFEMCNMCVEIHTTRDIGRQLLRHRSIAFQEFSQRYAAVSAWNTHRREARMQDPKNRQNSVTCEDVDVAENWRSVQNTIAGATARAYQWAINAGIAKEVARAVLPEGLTPTRMYANASIRSWLHFCDVRRGHGTQKEAVAIADEVWGILREVCPNVVEAWGMVENTK